MPVGSALPAGSLKLKEGFMLRSCRWIVAVAGLLLVAAVAPALASADTSFVGSTNLNGAPLRNNFSGSVGMQFTTGSPAISVAQLCRYFVSGNSGTHTLTLATTGGTTLGSVSVNEGAGTPVNGYKCASLSTQIPLAANTSYYLVSAETSGGDQWYDYSTALTPTSGAGSIPSAVYNAGSYTTYGSTGNSYGPVNFYYNVASTRSGTFYISNSGCSDANVGTSSSAPWCTFNNVNSSTFAAGSEILLARGSTWYQAFTPSGSGTSSSWISVDAYGSGALPIIRGNNNASDRTIVMYNPDYWSFSNLELSYAGEGIVVDYTTLGHQGLSFKNIYAHDINTIFHGAPQQTDFPNAYNSSAITIGTDTATPTSGQWAIKGITIDGLNATNTQGIYVDNGGGLQTVGAYSQYPPNTVQNLVLKNSWLHYMPAPGIALSSTENSYVHSNHIDCSGHVAEAQGTTCYFAWRDTNIVTANNVIANMPDTGSNDESGIDLEDFLDQMAERGNFFYNTAGAAIEMLQLGLNGTGYSTNNIISSNTFINNGVGTGWGNIYLWEAGCCGTPSGTISDNLTNGVENGNFSLFSQSNNVSVTSTNTNNSAWNFAGTQGANQWSYQYYNGLSWTNFSTYDSTNKRWSLNNAFVAEMGMNPDSNGASAISRTWTAPVAGTIQIRGQVFKSDTSGGDGVAVDVSKNGTVIWPSAGGTYTIGATDQNGLTSTVNSVTVAAGDQIRFEVSDGSANNSTADTTSWMPSIAYTSTSSPPPGTSFVSSVNLGTAPLRNDFSGSVGMQITVGSTAISVSQLCRYYVSGNSGTHTLTLATTAGVALGSVSINMGAGTPDANGFKCATLASGIGLAANTSYYVVSSETNGGDQWRDYNVTLTPTSVGSIPSAVYNAGSYTTYGSTGNSYGPVNLYYY